MPSRTLSDCIEAYLVACASHDRPATLRHKRGQLGLFLTRVGNIQVTNVTPAHLDQFLVERRDRGVQPSTLNNNRQALTQFFGWCVKRRLIPPLRDPSSMLHKMRVAEKQRLRVPAKDFPALLDGAVHPRDRIVVALGLYLLLRQSEIALLHVGSVDLSAGLIDTVISRTGQVDRMPISAELDVELRRWFAHYEADQRQPLDPSWRLTPARRPPRRVPNEVGARAFTSWDDHELRPEKSVSRMPHIVHASLAAAGYATRDSEGVSNGEGIHTLRRSGARALYDQLVTDGHDGAVRVVQAMLHHADASMTERYIGTTLDRKRRDDILKGRTMYAAAVVQDETGSNVIPMRKAH